jgi:hypothetical protein
MTGTHEDLLGLWAARNVSQRRAIVAAMLTTVTVGPSQGRKYAVSRFEPTWRV